MTTVTRKLFLDDLRNPKGVDYSICRNVAEAIEYCIKKGCPEFISFDHDLGEHETAMAFVKWLVNTDIGEYGKFIPTSFTFHVHSANPVGKANIEGLLNGYLNFRSK